MIAVTPFAPDAKTHPGMVYGVQHPFTGELVYRAATSAERKRSERERRAAMAVVDDLERVGIAVAEQDA